MIWFILLALGFAILVWPSFWVKSVLKKHTEQRNDLPGTGGELARHLKERFQMNTTIESTDDGDRFDPDSNTVYLETDNMNGRHLTAIATAAHEMAHAIQFQQNDNDLIRRGKMVRSSGFIQRVGQVCLILLPILPIFPGGALLAGFLIIPVLGSIAYNTLVHLVTLPVEWKASFNIALPILAEGDYLSGQDLKSVRKILMACALTYVSSAAFSMLNLANLFRILRR